jgi:tyrosyl-tRNA synthetase
VLFEKCQLSKTRAEARRLIAQGGGYVNGERIETFDQMISPMHVKNGTLLLRAGKKRYLRVTVVD